jgi:hypothetical protein
MSTFPLALFLRVDFILGICGSISTGEACMPMAGLPYTWGLGVDGVRGAFRGVLVGSGVLWHVDGPAAGKDCTRGVGDFW